MFFKKRIDRIREIKQTEEEFKKNLENEPLEKKDGLALIIAALIVFLPALILVIAVFLLATIFFF